MRISKNFANFIRLVNYYAPTPLTSYVDGVSCETLAAHFDDPRQMTEWLDQYADDGGGYDGGRLLAADIVGGWEDGEPVDFYSEVCLTPEGAAWIAAHGGGGDMSDFRFRRDVKAPKRTTQYVRQLVYSRSEAAAAHGEIDTANISAASKAAYKAHVSRRVVEQ